MFRLSLKFAVLSGFWLSSISLAEVGFTDSHVWRRARMVFPGQKVFSVRSSFERSDDRFNSAGRLEPVGNGFSQPITWGELLANEANEESQSSLQRYMREQNIKADDVAAVTSYGVMRETVGISVDWAYGLTRNWTVGLHLPVSLSKMEIRSEVRPQPSLARAQLDVNVASATESELTQNGFDGLPDSEERWVWGDTDIINQFGILRRQNWTWSLQQTLRFPTARNPNTANYFEALKDDGNMDLGLTTLTDYYYKRWIFGLRGGYVMQLPDSTRMRLERNEEQTEVDPEVSRDLGDWVWAAADTSYRVGRQLGLQVEHAYLYKNENRYESGDTNFAELEDDTSQELHRSRVNVTYDFLAQGRRSGVENRWQANLSYAYPWSGRNSLDASQTAVEVISYF